MTAVIFGLVCLAGGLGAAARLVLDRLVQRNRSVPFPVATWLINISGSLLLGLVTGVAVSRLLPHPAAMVAGTGFLGGYTTFSTASVETVRLAEQRRYVAAAANALGMLVFAVAAAWAGLLIGRAL